MGTPIFHINKLTLNLLKNEQGKEYKYLKRIIFTFSGHITSITLIT